MTWFGVHDEVEVEGLARKFPGARTDRVFLPGVQAPGTDLPGEHMARCARHYAAGLVPIVSVKLAPEQVTSGRWDAALAAYGRFLAEAPPTWIVYWHEPENDMSGEAFASAFARVRERLRAEAPVPVGYAAMAYQWRPGAAATREAGPWRVDADFYGIDLYSGGSVAADTVYWRHPGVVRWWERLVTPVEGQDRWAVTERGFKSGADAVRADVITREGDELAVLATEPVVWVYWNTPGTEGERGMVAGARAEEAMRRVVGTRACTCCGGDGRVPR